MKTSLRLPVVTFVFALLLSACSSVQVSTDYDPDANFSGLKTYDWVPIGTAKGAGQADDQLTDKRIREAIESNLNTKGFSKVDSGGDFAVGYQLVTQDDVSYETMADGWGGGWRWGGWGMGSATTTAIHTTVGTLVIAIFEGTSKETVWHGSGQSDVHKTSDPEQRQKNIDAAVDKILASFPPTK